jgi:hypothetical protein
MIPFGGTVSSRGGLEACVQLHVPHDTWREALSCSVWIESQVYMFGLGLNSLGH